MPDFTNGNLEAALLDQKVAGMYSGKTYCFVAVVAKGGWQLGVAAANERGYTPIRGKTFDNEKEARAWAQGLNEHIGHTDDEAVRIVVSTMGGKAYYKKRVA